MFQIQTNNIRSRLRFTASALTVLAGIAGSSGAAMAADVILSNANSPWALDGNSTSDNVVVQSGSTAFLTAGYNSGNIPAGDLGLTWGATPSMSSTTNCAFQGCTMNADTITVNSGGKVIIDNPWNWQPFQSIFNATGTVEVLPASGQTIFMGTNTFLGNLVIDASAVGNTSTVQVGQPWQAASLVFGSNTNISIGTGSLLEFWVPSASPEVLPGVITGTGTVAVHSGSFVYNGNNTASNAFTGTMNVVDSGTFVVGDASNPSAVFGDPVANSTVVKVQSVGASIGVLKGYGTIDGQVTNAGVVRPGGTSGTIGTLTINGSYTQSSAGQLILEVSPTSASALKVNGNATLAGSLIINLDSGTYSNAVYNNVISASSISGSFNSVSVTGNTAGAMIGVQQTSTSNSIVIEKASAPQVFGHLAGANRNALYQFSRSLYDVMAVGTPATTVAGGKVNVWLTPIASIENVGRNGDGYEDKTVGLSVGADHRFAWHNAVLGGAFSYRNSQMDVKGETTTASTNGYDMAVYGGADVQNARIDGMLFYSMNESGSKRFMTGYGTSAADESGWAWGMSVQVSRNLFNDLITPYLRGTFARVHQSGVSESGTGTFDLAYKAINLDTFAADAGLRVHLLRPQTDRPLKLDLDLAVRHDFSDAGETTTGSFASLTGSSFTYNWKGDSQNALLVGVSVSDQIMDKLELFGRVNGTFTLYRRAGEIAVGAKYHL